MFLRSLLRQFIEKRRRIGAQYDRNRMILEHELAEVARQFEQMPYERLLEPSHPDDWIMSRTVDGQTLWFSGELAEVLPDGTLMFAIVAHGLPHSGRSRPGWLFYKRPDGTVVKREY